jgi:hypothetical protein
MVRTIASVGLVALMGMVSVVAEQTRASESTLVPGLTISKDASGVYPIRLRHVSSVQTFEAQASSLRTVTRDERNRLMVELGPGSYVARDATRSTQDAYARLYLTLTDDGSMIAFKIDK